MIVPKIGMIVLILGISGCAVNVEQSYRECLLMGGDASYVVTKDMAKIDCKL